MEKQSTRKFLSLMIAMVALFVLGLSGVLLSACDNKEHNYVKDEKHSIAASCQSIGLDFFKCSDDDGAWDAKPLAATPHTYDSNGVCTGCGLTKAAEVDYAKELEASFTKLQTALEKKIETEAAKLLTPEDIANLATQEDVTKALESAKAELKSTADGLNAVLNGIDGKLDGIKTQIETLNTNLDSALKSILDAIKTGHVHVFDEAAAGKVEYCDAPGYAYNTCTVCGEVVTTAILPALNVNHSWDKANADVVLEANCTEYGMEVISCTKCDATYQLPIAPQADKHVWGEWETVSEATCAEKAVQTRECTVCGETETEEFGELGAHTTTATEPQREASNDCTVGDKTYYICDVCGQKFGEETAEPVATEHSFPADSRVLKDCEAGLEALEVKCTNEGCEETHTYEAVAPITAEEHVKKAETNEENAFDEITAIDLNKKSATITTYAPCPDCGKFIAIATHTERHIWEPDTAETEKQPNVKADENAEYGYVNTSCTEDAYVYYWCADNNCATYDADGNITASKAVGKILLPALGHSFTNYVETKAPTCTEAGEEKAICDHEGCDVVDVRPIEALGHVWGDWTITKEATCEEDGLQERFCTVCNEKEEEVIPAIGHNYVASEPVIVTEDGKHYEITTSICTNCGDEKEDRKEIDHNFILLDRHSGGCENWGYPVYVCDICYEGDVNDLLLLANNKELNKMIAAGSAYVDRTVEPLAPNGHNYELVLSGEENCLDVIQRVYICKYCGQRDTVTDNVPEGHKWVKVEGTPATCDVAGQKTFYYCSVCNLVIVSEEMPTETAKDYWTDAAGKPYQFDPTAKADGEAENPNAALLESLVIPATGHTFDKEVKVLVGSCTEPNWTIMVCSVCGVDEDGNVVIKADAEGVNLVEKYADSYTAAVTEGASEDEIKVVLAALAEQYNVELEELTNGAGYNFTAIEYAAKAGHTWTKLVEAKAPTCQETGYKAAWYCEVCGIVYEGAEQPDKDAEANTEFVVTIVDGEPTDLEDVKKNFVLATVDHDVKYYMYVVENLDAENFKDVAVVTNEFVMDGENKKVYTYDEIVEMGYVNADGTVNCYFKAFCDYGCGTDLGFDQQHVYPTEENLAKYPTCQHIGYCVWCTTPLLPLGEHLVKPVSELNAEDVEALKDLAWFKEDVAPTCEDDGVKYTISVCVACLDALNNGETVTWIKDQNYFVEEAVDPALGHDWEAHTYAIGGGEADANCLVGSYKIDICTRCGETRIETELDDETLRTDEEGKYDIQLPKSHNVAPVINYWMDGNNYIPVSATQSAHMSFVCIECGARVQGGYGEKVYTADGKLLQYTVASDDEVKAYVEAGETLGKVHYVADEYYGARPEDRVIPVVVNAATAEDVTNALASESEVITVTLTENVEVDFAVADTAKNVTINLNGKTLTLTNAGSILIEDGKNFKFVGDGENGGKLVLPELANDQGNYNGTVGMFWVNNATATFENLTIEGKNVIAFAGGEAPALGKIEFKNCTITTSGNYAVATNASKSADSNVEIVLEGCKIVAAREDGDAAAVFVNVPAAVTIKDCEITADRQPVTFRGGNINATIENTKITLTNKYANKDQYYDGNWSSGNEVPMAAIVIGNGNKTGGYQAGKTTVTLKNVEIVVEADANAEKVPASVLISTFEAAGVTVDFTYDEACTGVVVTNVTDPVTGDENG